MTLKIIGPDDPALAAARKNIAEHPQWNLELTVYPWADYRDVMMESLNADITPNQAVFVPGHVWIPELAAAGLITELDPLFSELPEAARRDYHWENVITAVKKESQYLDRQYMIPYFNDAQILFYREDLVRLQKSIDPPEISPLDLVDLARKAHQPPDIYGIALKAHPSEIFFDWLPYLLAAGGQIADSDLLPTFRSEAGIQALSAYLQLREYAPPQTGSFGNEEIAAVIKNGRAAFVTTWGGQASPIFLDERNLFREKYQPAIFPFPCGGTWGIALPSNQSGEILLKTLQVLLSLNSPEADKDVLLAAGSPIREDSYTQSAYQKYSWLRAQRKVYDRVSFLPFDPRIRVFLGPLTENLVSAFKGKISPEGALETAHNQIMEALKNIT